MVDAIQATGQGNSAKKPPIDPTIKAQLDKLGIQPTGSKAGDTAAIAAAQGTQGTSGTDSATTLPTEQLFSTEQTEQSSNTQQRPPIDESIQSQLTELGIKATGTKEGDLEAIKLKLAEQEQNLFMN